MTAPDDTTESADRPPDDRVIGRAFWASAAVVGVVAGGVVLWRKWPRTAPPAAPVAPLPAGPAVIAALPNEPLVVDKLFDEIVPKYADRTSGYCRITKIGIRQGDSSPLVQIELV